MQSLTASWATPPAGSTPAVPWAHLFQGLEFTDVTGLAYVRYRDYSASLGRFIELDPIGFDAGDNNWYRFVANGPTGQTDPSGLTPARVVATCKAYCKSLGKVLDRVVERWYSTKWCRAYQCVCRDKGCTDAEHATLQAAVNEACKSGPRACNPSQDLATLRANLVKNIACAEAREAINRRCFPPAGDAGHRQAAGDDRKAAARCQALIAQKTGAAP